MRGSLEVFKERLKMANIKLTVNKDDAVTKEMLAKGKDVAKDFDESQGVWVKPKRTKPISIRLTRSMLWRLKQRSKEMGDIGYQQVIKVYIERGLKMDSFPTSGSGFTVHQEGGSE